jgi:DNA-binding transcriptional LysR family regulator
MDSQLKRIDLNLLVALRALLENRNVSRAAEAMGVTQPAMSNTLARLRDLFDDQLLVRGPGGLIPTSRAAQLAIPLQQLLKRIEDEIFQERTFDPTTSTRRFTIGISDYASVITVPDLVQAFTARAPNCQLAIRPLPAYTPYEQLASGELDLCVAFVLDERPGLLCRRVIEDDYVCIVRADHPEVGKSMSLKKYCSLKHAVVSPLLEYGDDLRGVVDEKLEKLGCARQVVLSVPHFFIAPMVIAKTDLVLTTASKVAHMFRDYLELKILPAPVEMHRFQVNLVWHERSDGDPANVWLRKTITEITDRISKAW